jgi:hypothetical protein
MQTTKALYEGEHIQILESVDEDGDVLRQLLLGPPFNNPQGMIKTNRPKYHVQPFTRNLTYGAVCVSGGVENALFLGLGAGVVVQAVRDLFPAASIDIVDLDTELFSISNEFFFRIDAANVRWFAEDASLFVKRSDRRYDYICCDIWGDHLEAPPFLAERDFIAAVRKSLNTRGIFSLSTQWFLHKPMTELLTSEFEFVFSVRAPTCLLHAMNVPPKSVTDDQLVADLRSKNLDLNAIRANSTLMRAAREDDFDAQPD